jgi:hypothetical protein
MAQSSLLGATSAPLEPEGRDTARLGPSDTTDSGSDVAVLPPDTADPAAPVDVALRDDIPHPLPPGEAIDGNPEVGADIATDHVFSANAKDGETISDDEDADLAFIDEAQAVTPPEDEEEDEDTGEEDPEDREPGRRVRRSSSRRAL